MASNVFNLPPMPAPQDYGITDLDWKNYDSPFSQEKAKVKAYYAAVEAWKAAVSALKP